MTEPNMEDPSSELCPVCYESNQLKSNFDCPHQLCRECFCRQISSDSSLCCPMCRASPNPNSFDDDEQKLYGERRRRQTERESERRSIQFDAHLYSLLRGILDDYTNNQIINQEQLILGNDELIFRTVINNNNNNYEFRILTLQNN